MSSSVTTVASTAPTTAALSDRSRRAVASPIQSSDVYASRAEGHEVFDEEGRRYIDFAGGVGCLNVGHRHPAVVSRLEKQLQSALHVGYSVVQYALYTEVCEKLVSIHPGVSDHSEYRAALFCTGGEAVEAAVKVARSATGRPGIICLDRGFHGRSLLNASMSYKASPYRTRFGPLPPAVFHTRSPSADVDIAEAVRSLDWVLNVEIDPSEVAAIVYEPIQGEGGFNVLPVEYLEHLQEVCQRHSILLVSDEIQSGIGRTGLPAAGAHTPSVRPDIVCWGKSLGGGLPLSAVTAPAELFDSVPAGGLASGTFGGNPLACAAATEVLDIVQSEDFKKSSLALGQRLRQRLEGLRDRHPQISMSARGVGPMLAIELLDLASKPASKLVADTVKRARGDGLLIKSCGPAGNVLRFLMPITTPLDALDEGLGILENALDSALAERGL